jgi:hypothetical protein
VTCLTPPGAAARNGFASGTRDCSDDEPWFIRPDCAGAEGPLSWDMRMFGIEMQQSFQKLNALDDDLLLAQESLPLLGARLIAAKDDIDVDRSGLKSRAAAPDKLHQIG